MWGYHGTTEKNAKAILKKGFRLSQNPWDWLGDGVYFWQDAPHRAASWGQETSQRDGAVKTAVIRAKLNLGDCIDLIDTEWSDVIQENVRTFKKLLRLEGRALVNTKKGNHALDAAFFNYLADALFRQGTQVSSIRAAIAEGRPMLKNSPIRLKAHVQIAIRDLTLIEDPEIV